MKKLRLHLSLLLAVFTVMTLAASQLLATSNFVGPLNLTATGMSVALRGQGGSGLVVEASGITGTVALNLFGSAGGTVWTKMTTVNCANGARSLTITANGAYCAAASGFRYLSLSASTLASGQGLATTSLGWGEGQPCYNQDSGSSAQNPAFYILVQTFTSTITPSATPTSTSTVTPTLTVTP